MRAARGLGPWADRLRMAAVVALLLGPALPTVRETFERERYSVRRDSRLSPRAAHERLSGRKERALRNLPLLRAARARIPSGSTFQWVPRGAFTSLGPDKLHQRLVLVTGWADYYLAPRVAVDEARAPWALVLGASPADAGVRAHRAWRYGDDWLVRR